MKRNIGIWIAIILIAGIFAMTRFTNIFSKNKIYYGFYEDVRGLQESSPVYLHGVKVGKIEEIDLSIQQDVRVVFALKKDLALPKGTKAVITRGDVSGSKTVRLEPGASPEILQPESSFITGFDSSVSENFHAKITPVVRSGEYLLNSADTALYDFNRLIRGGWGRETQKSFASINNKFIRGAAITGKANQKLQRFQAVLNKMDTLVHGKNDLNEDIANVKNATEQLRKKQLRAEMRSIQKGLNNLSAGFKKLQQHKMIADTQAYQGFSKSLDTFQRSADEYMKNPPPLIKIP